MGGLGAAAFPMAKPMTDVVKGPATDLARYAANEIKQFDLDDDALTQYQALGGSNADKLRGATYVTVDGKKKYFDSSGAEFKLDEDLYFDKIMGTKQKRKEYLELSSDRPGRRGTILGDSGNTSTLPYSPGSITPRVLG